MYKNAIHVNFLLEKNRYDGYTYIPYDSDRCRRYRKQFLELYDFGTKSFTGFFQRLLRDDCIGPTGFNHSGQRARHTQAV